MIVGFSDRKTEAFYDGRRIAAFSGFARTASRKLDPLDAATSVGDLARPVNRLEALKGRHKGQWCIRINDPCGSAVAPLYNLRIRNLIAPGKAW